MLRDINVGKEFLRSAKTVTARAVPEFFQPNPWMILPFLLLLGLIALAPLLFAGWWGRHYPKVALVLGAVVVAYYFFGVNRADHVFEKTRD